MEKMIPLSRPFLGAEEISAASRAITSLWVTQGPEVLAFENEFAAYVGAPYACAVSSCTSALHLALLAVGVMPGDEVITPSHSFIATANSILYCGAKPVFVDISPHSFNVSPQKVKAAITPRTRAILCVHQMGMPCDVLELKKIAQQYHIALIEDAACAIGSEIVENGRWKKIGSPIADIACFSFHPRKLLTTGDGGMITTLNRDWDAKFRLWRQHSMSVPDAVRHGSKEVVFEKYLEKGFNYRLTDIQAAIGREQLKRLPEILAVRRSQAARYQSLLTDIAGLELPQQPNWAKTNFQTYCVRLPSFLDQNKIMQYMLDHGIATRRGVMCAHREPAFEGKELSRLGSPLPESERAQDTGISLPLFHALTAGEQEKVATTLRKACTESKNEKARHAA